MNAFRRSACHRGIENICWYVTPNGSRKLRSMRSVPHLDPGPSRRGTLEKQGQNGLGGVAGSTLTLEMGNTFTLSGDYHSRDPS